MGSPQVYRYKTLAADQFRILHLFAGAPSDELSGTLETSALPSEPDDGSSTPVSSPPSYQAVSYCWGSKEATSQIYLPHTKFDTTQPFLRIRPNLANALRCLRKSIPPGESRPFWTDSICINQSDIPERNSQIQKIADIYSEAEIVHIWLGDETENSNLAMQFAQEIKNPKYFEKALSSGDSAKALAAFSNLMRRDWFSRRWIVQEISLARTAIVHCGDQSIPWDDLEEAISVFSTMHKDVRKEVRGSKLLGNPIDFLGEVKGMGATHLVEIASNIVQRTPLHDRSVMDHRMSLEGLMSTMTMFETSNPYDIVYALLWLAYDVKPHAALQNINVQRTPVASPARSPTFQSNLNVSQHSPHRRRNASISSALRKEEVKHGQSAKALIVDYNMTLFQCYKKFLEHVLLQSKSLDIICRAWALAPQDMPQDGAEMTWKPEPSLPTWIQTLDDKKIFAVNPTERTYERVRADPLVGNPGTGPRSYNACGKRKHEARPNGTMNEAERSLTTRGFALGEIYGREDPASQGNIPEDWLTAVGWISPPHIREQSSGPLDNDSRPNWLWKFLVAERGQNGYEPPPMRFRSACTWLLDHRTRNNGLKTDTVAHGSAPNTAKEFIERTRDVVWNRRLITIAYHPEGDLLFGLAPKEAKTGDLVCILYGCSVPVVLRLDQSTTKPSQPDPASVSGAPTISVEEVDHDGENGSTGKRPRLEISVLQGLLPPGSPTVPDVSESRNLPQIAMMDSDLSEERFQFIGECYVYGMMAGEAFNHRDVNKIRSRFYTLI